MTSKRIDYASYPMDAASLLEEYEITRRHISEDDRIKTVEYLSAIIDGKKDDTPWEFTLNEVTVVGQGDDEAVNFRGKFS